MSGKFWTKEEIDYLENTWGTLPIPSIAKNLGRSVEAVKLKARRSGLGSALEAGDYITFNQLVIAVTGSKSGSTGKQNSWIKERGLPVRKKRVDKSYFKVVYIDKFWEWAYKNRSFLNFAKMEPLILGEEPEWVAEQRRMDSMIMDPQREEPWTSQEDSRLEMLVNQFKYTTFEISRMMNRSEGAILKRCQNIGLKSRPLAAKHEKWTQKDLEELAEYIKRAVPYELISRETGKSVKAIKTKVAYIYLTFDQNKVREMIGEGTWGEGAPSPTVKKALWISRTKTGVKKDLSRLAGLLKYRAEQKEETH